MSRRRHSEPRIRTRDDFTIGEQKFAHTAVRIVFVAGVLYAISSLLSGFRPETVVVWTVLVLVGLYFWRVEHGMRVPTFVHHVYRFSLRPVLEEEARYNSDMRRRGTEFYISDRDDERASLNEIDREIFEDDEYTTPRQRRDGDDGVVYPPTI